MGVKTGENLLLGPEEKVYLTVSKGTKNGMFLFINALTEVMKATSCGGFGNLILTDLSLGESKLTPDQMIGSVTFRPFEKVKTPDGKK